MADEGSPELNSTSSSQTNEFHASGAPTDPNNPTHTPGKIHAALVSEIAIATSVNPPRKYTFGFGWLSFTFYILAYPTCKSVYDVIDWLKTHNAGGSLRNIWNTGILVVEEGFHTAETNLGAFSMDIVSNLFLFTSFVCLLTTPYRE